MRIEVVSSPVGEIKWGEGVLTPYGRSHACSLDITCARK